MRRWARAEVPTAVDVLPGSSGDRDLRLYTVRIGRPRLSERRPPLPGSRDGRIAARPHPPRAARPRAVALRSGARAASGLRRPAAAVQQRLSGRREHPGLARARSGRRGRGRLAAADRRQPVRRDPRPGLLPPVRVELQPQGARRLGVDPRGRALPRGPRQRAEVAVPRSGDPQRSPGARRRLRPVRALGRLPPGPDRARGRRPRQRTAAGRDDALRHPGLSAAARRPRRGDRPDRGHGRRLRAGAPGHRPRGRAAGLRRASSSRSART